MATDSWLAWLLLGECIGAVSAVVGILVGRVTYVAIRKRARS